MNFVNYLKGSGRNGSEVSTVATELLKEEIEKREKEANIFPLDVFNPAIKPFITALNHNYDVPRAYVGLAMLAAYSTAIGSSYVVSPNGFTKIFLPVWGCLCGISSSGKSLAIDLTHEPIFKIQDDFDRRYEEEIKPLPREARERARIETLVYRDAHIPTLVRYYLPQNPKGVLKHSDELLEWINGLNALGKGKESTDEQFWLSAWNCKKYSGLRSGADKFVVHRTFVNVIGGIQPTIMYKLFAKDRDTTGFIFRMLFALPDEMKVAEPDSNYFMPQELMDIHANAINKLYFDLKVDDAYDEPKKCILTREAVNLHEEWVRKKVRLINQMQEVSDKEIHSGILGKIKEYAYRFSGILQLADKSYEDDAYKTFKGFNTEERIDSEVMARALKLADYFYRSAADSYETVQTKVTAPPDVLIAATLFRQGASMEKIANAIYGDGKKYRQKAWRNVKVWIKDYPKIFNANNIN
jgi:hypothetical protein